MYSMYIFSLYDIIKNRKTSSSKNFNIAQPEPPRAETFVRSGSWNVGSAQALDLTISVYQIITREREQDQASNINWYSFQKIMKALFFQLKVISSGTHKLQPKPKLFESRSRSWSRNKQFWLRNTCKIASLSEKRPYYCLQQYYKYQTMSSLETEAEPGQLRH